VPQSAILGAALASTDPVLLRGVLRNPDTPPAARTALRIESGMNDAVLLPIVLVAMAVIATAGTGAARPGWMGPALAVLLLGGGAGVVVALVGIGGLQLARRRLGLQRDYESLYALGLALAAYAVGEAVHGSGYIAAFVAGITVAWLDLELCDCFFDYGQATSEMALLFTFVALGGSALWLGLGVADGRTLAFAGIALFARTLILLPLIRTAPLDPASRRLVLWLGPRGLSTLLLVLLPVFAGSAGSERVFAVAALVVLLSIIVHGGAQVLLWPRAGGGDGGAAAVEDADRLTLAGLDELRRRGESVVLLDVRKDGDYAGSATRVAGARRVPPTRPVETVSAFGLPPDTWLVSYCT
jgi:NhaP-type Na+/H+ or K+/H+ antiporter